MGESASPSSCIVPSGSQPIALEHSPLYRSLEQLVRREPFLGITLRAYETSRSFWPEPRRIEQREIIRAFALFDVPRAAGRVPRTSTAVRRPPGLRTFRHWMEHRRLAAYFIDYAGGRLAVLSPALTPAATAELRGVLAGLPDHGMAGPMPVCASGADVFVSPLDRDRWYRPRRPVGAPSPMDYVGFTENPETGELERTEALEIARDGAAFHEAERERSESVTEMLAKINAAAPKCWNDPRYDQWKAKVATRDDLTIEGFDHEGCKIFDEVVATVAQSEVAATLDRRTETLADIARGLMQP